MSAVYEQGWNDAAVLHVLHHLRLPDLKEAEALQGGFDPFETHARYRQMLGMAAYFAVFRARPLAPPVALAGIWRRWGGNGSAHLLATPELRPMAHRLLRHLRETVRPQVAAMGFTRIDCQSWAGNGLHHKLIRGFGVHEERRLPLYGVDADDFIDFVWYPQREEASHVPEQQSENPRAGACSAPA